MVSQRLKLIRKFFGEGKELIDKDPVQSSEKLYKAVEESVKTLAYLYDLKDVLEKVDKHGRWTVAFLESVVKKLRDRVEGLREAWDVANYLHVWGFHEGKLDKESIEMRIPSIEKLLRSLEEIVEAAK